MGDEPASTNIATYERSTQANSHEISETLSKMLLDAILCIVAFKRVVWLGSLTDEMLATLSIRAPYCCAIRVY